MWLGYRCRLVRCWFRLRPVPFFCHLALRRGFAPLHHWSGPCTSVRQIFNLPILFCSSFISAALIHRPLSRQPITLCCTNIARFVKMLRSSTEDPILGFQSLCTWTGANQLQLPGVGELGHPDLRASPTGRSPSAPHRAFTPMVKQRTTHSQISATKPPR